MSFDIHDRMQAPLKTDIVCLEWRPCDRNTLKGFAKVNIPKWGITLDGLAVHEKEGRRWAQLPARPQLDNDGNAIREDSGKIRYAKIMEFNNKEVGWKFSDQVVAAVARKAAGQ
jgi:hypothetical protein